MALQGNALKEYNAQFQRSIASPEALSDKKKPVVLDGAAVLDKYIGGESAAAMTGAEFYALVGHIKRQHGQRGEALEQELMKVTRQMDKKIRLLDWCTTNLGRKEEPIAQPTAAIQAAAAAMANENLPPAGTPSRPMATKPALEMSVNKLDLRPRRRARVGASTARRRRRGRSSAATRWPACSARRRRRARRRRVRRRRRRPASPPLPPRSLLPTCRL